ncbi:MAG TPA: ABC transporter ATP-binding protein, partial [Ruminococcaceae bacterium]|nr:ABC transporter ATP-binding protein [Oscillospiraceae bacterium]
MAVSVLETKNLGIAFGGLQALDDIHFTVKPGEIMGLIGPNGAGKTTVFNLLTSVYSPSEGQIRLGGRSIVGEKTFRITRNGIARTFQNIRLF